MLDQFMASVGGPTKAANILLVSGAIVTRWTATGPSRKAAKRIAAWLKFEDEAARFILRNVWAHEARIWTPEPEQYRRWVWFAIDAYHKEHGSDKATELWREINNDEPDRSNLYGESYRR